MKRVELCCHSKFDELVKVVGFIRGDGVCRDNPELLLENGTINVQNPTDVGIAEEIWREGFFKVYYPEVYDEVMNEYDNGALGNEAARFGRTVFESVRRSEERK